MTQPVRQSLKEEEREREGGIVRERKRRIEKESHVRFRRKIMKREETYKEKDSGRVGGMREEEKKGKKEKKKKFKFKKMTLNLMN